jgi:hypothetical protein
MREAAMNKALWLLGALGTFGSWSIWLQEAGSSWDGGEILTLLLIPGLWTLSLIFFRPRNEETADLELEITKTKLKLEIADLEVKIKE